MWCAFEFPWMSHLCVWNSVPVCECPYGGPRLILVASLDLSRSNFILIGRKRFEKVLARAGSSLPALGVLCLGPAHQAESHC